MAGLVGRALKFGVLLYRESIHDGRTARAEIVALCLLNERNRSNARIDYSQKTVQPALRNAALVCRAWYRALRKHLYNEIYVSSPRGLDLLSRALTENVRLRRLVRQFHFTGTIFSSGNILDRRVKKDLCLREREIIRLCPNLSPAFVGEQAIEWNPEKVCEVVDYDVLLRIGLQFYTLTHLEVHLRSGLPHIFPKTFPSLQSLKIDYLSPLYSDGFTPATLPKLRRLELIDVRLFNNDVLVLPKFAPVLNSIELEVATMCLTTDIFDPIRSPFLPFRKTLESLTIVGNYLELNLWYPRMLPKVGWRTVIKADEEGIWSLEFLENLVQLCIPFCVFARVGPIKYPPRLRHLVLFSRQEPGYSVKFSSGDIPWGLAELYRLISKRKKGVILRELERLEVPVDGIKTHEGFGRLFSKVDFGFLLKFGVHKSEFCLLLSQCPMLNDEIDVGKPCRDTFIGDSEIGPLARPGSFRYLLEVLRFKLYLLREKKRRR